MIPDSRFPAALADALDDAAATPAPLDAARLIADARQRVRRRRLTTALVVAMALVAAVVGVRLGQPDAPVMAGPTAVPDASVTAVLDGLAGGDYSVTVRAPDVVEYSAAQDAERVILGRSALDAPAVWTVFHRAGAASVVLGVVPDAAARVALLPRGDVAGYQGPVMAPLAGTGYQAFGLELADPTPPPQEVGLLWWLGDGTPVTTAGRGDAVRLSGAVGDFDVWVLPAERLVGFTGPRGAGGSTPWDPEVRVTALDGTVFREDATTSPSTVSAGASGVHLIRGAVSDVRVAFDDSATDADVVLRSWPALDVTVVAHTAELPPRPGTVTDLPPAVRAVTWIDADGRSQEWTAR